MKIIRPCLFLGIFVVLVVSAEILSSMTHHIPRVVVEVPGGLQITIVRNAHVSRATCSDVAGSLANAIRAGCPSCGVRAEPCGPGVETDLAELLGEEAVAAATARIPDGAVRFASSDPELALATCREAERRASYGGPVICYPAHTKRPLVHIESTLPGSTLVNGMLLCLIALFVSAFSAFLVVRYDRLHARWSHDAVDAGPQKFHAEPTPRIGGLCVMASLFVVSTSLLLFGDSGAREPFAYLALAVLPAFGAGLLEDITKNVGVMARLALTLVSAAFGIVLFNAIIPHAGVPIIDGVLRWHPFAIAFTLFAVSGVTNAVNIIDGYNGLAAGYALIASIALAIVAATVGDTFIFFASASMAGAVVGFLKWNYPRGRIFLGDSGAYLLGFWLAQLSVILVVRHPHISPWFPMLLMVYPVFETLFSIYRRKVLRGKSPGRPDRLHLHQVIYMRLVRKFVGTTDASQMTRRNSLVAPYIWWITAINATAAVIWREESSVLISAVVAFCGIYVWLYVSLVNWRAPAWLINSGRHHGL